MPCVSGMSAGLHTGGRLRRDPASAAGLESPHIPLQEKPGTQNGFLCEWHGATILLMVEAWKPLPQFLPFPVVP